MRRLLLRASEEKDVFFDLIGEWITHRNDTISVAGYITYPKGQRSYISDVEYTPGFYSRDGYWNKPKISTVKINGVPSQCWFPRIFEEFDEKGSFKAKEV